MVGHGDDHRLGRDIQPAHQVQGVVVDAHVRRVFVVGEVTDDLKAVGRRIRFHQCLVEMLVGFVDAVGIQVRTVGDGLKLR